MFIDEIDIAVTAGKGGDGHSSFAPRPEGPDGGNGGDGGDLYAIGTSDLTALSKYTSKPHISAEDGVNGMRKKMFGRRGKDISIAIPVGTTLTDKHTGQVFKIGSKSDKKLLCKGGIGGRGNYEFRSSTHQAPEESEPGTPGHHRQLHIVLKLIADFGFIGLPNAGKSSLLNELTGAHAKVANYNFTTLEPNLGVFNKKVIADIPGLIEGASEGKGLGIKFLKHIEKVGILFHCISSESENVLKDYKTVRKELESFSKVLIKKPEIILLTKHDLADEKTIKKQQASLKKLKRKILPISIHDWDSMEKLKKLMK